MTYENKIGVMLGVTVVMGIVVSIMERIGTFINEIFVPVVIVYAIIVITEIIITIRFFIKDSRGEYR